MDPLTALVAATPLFGFALGLAPAAPPDSLRSELATRQAQSASEDADPAATDDADADFDAELDAALGPDDDEYTAEVRERSEIAKIHRAFGISTWAVMGATVVLGTIQYYNLYGGSQSSNPCVEGNAVFGQGQCSGTPWPHLLGAMATTALYATTLSLSFLMPDPDGAAEGDTDFAQRLRTHKALRWVHFTGMIAQLVLGIVIANGDSFGLDRANDYGTLQALGAVHMALGFVTWGAVTWSGALMGMFD